MTVLGLRRCDVIARASPEESDRLEMETYPLNRHDRPIFDPRNVVRSEGVPEHDVSVLERTISRRPLWKSGSAFMLEGVIARWILFSLIIRRNPQVAVHEASALTDHRFTLRHRIRRVARNKFVPHWCANVV